jgi:hypothetical protein
MNKTILTVALAVALFTKANAQNTTATAPAAAAPAPSGPLSDLAISGAMDYESQYVFRGKKIANSSFQPNVNLAYPVYGGSLNAYVWTNQPIAPRGGTPPTQTADEIDLGTYYTYPLTFISKDATIDVGYQYYWYPEASGTNNNLDRSQEVHIGLQWDTTSLLGGYNINPQVYYYHDFVLDGNVLQFSLAYTWDLSDIVGLKDLTLNPSMNIGWDAQNRTRGDQLIPGAQNWSNSYIYWTGSLELDYKVNSVATLFLGVRYSGNNDGNAGGPGGINPQLGGSDENIWVGLGVKFGM